MSKPPTYTERVRELWRAWRLRNVRCVNCGANRRAHEPDGDCPSPSVT